MDIDPPAEPSSSAPDAVAETDEADRPDGGSQLGDDEDSDDEDQEDPADVAMVPMADMLNARFESENVRPPLAYLPHTTH